ncbi:hypothetical protein VTN77DRAFT_8465 [Rasamsonia byssochlamydoides]|uniref:uncharacterized protein n=1 Tax=Rasamsonia byssochlamydoides TaxID=89139 RepID=UPI0037422269
MSQDFQTRIRQLLEEVMPNYKPPDRPEDVSPSTQRIQVAPGTVVSHRFDEKQLDFVQTDILLGGSAIVVVSEEAFLMAHFPLEANPRRGFHITSLTDGRKFTQPMHVDLLLPEVRSWQVNRLVTPYVCPQHDLQAYIRIRPILDQPDRVWQWPEVALVAMVPSRGGEAWLTDCTAYSSEYHAHLPLPEV